MREDEYWALRDDVSDDDIPVAELSDETRVAPVRRGRRPRRVAGAFLALALATAGVIAATHLANDNNRAHGRVEPGTHREVESISDAQARSDVLAALSSTTASGSFKIRYHLSADTPGGPVMALSGEGVVNVSPMAQVTTSDVPGLGGITTRLDGTKVWEDGGANYGMTPSTNTGAGAPLSQFAGLVTQTLGPREGAVAMLSLASPTGYLDLAKGAITAASSLGAGTVDGVSVHQYEVTIDMLKEVDRPDLTYEEHATAVAATLMLRSEGYTTTTVRLSIDDLGFIRRAQRTIRFRDGGTVTGDTTFSDFGCSSVVMFPNGPSIVANPSGCSSSPATTTTTEPAATGTTSADPPVQG